MRVTLGRADLWDHRGGMPWTAAQNFRDLRAALEAGDEARVKAMFAYPPPAPGEPKQPFVVPVGTVEFDLGAGLCLDSATLDIERGSATILARRADGKRGLARIRLDFDLKQWIEVRATRTGTLLLESPWGAETAVERRVSGTPPRTTRPDVRGVLALDFVRRGAPTIVTPSHAQ